jgi:cytidylate kinase
MIVTIDGPAGAGKSSVARLLAERLDFKFLDTGAMYRAVAWAAQQQKLDWNDADGLAELASGLNIEVHGSQTLVNGEDVSDAIRTVAVTSNTQYAANNPAVRAHLVELQRRVGENQDIITEGRDQGTVAFPDAGCKFFLTATPLERARRRLRDFEARGEQVTLDDVLADQEQRDLRDADRNVGPLVAATDAIVLVTDEMSTDEVVDHLEGLVRMRMLRASQQPG